MEATSYSILKAKHMAWFLENNIICQFGVPHKLMELYNIQHHKSSLYRPQANEAIEVANKNVKNILAKMEVTYKD